MIGTKKNTFQLELKNRFTALEEHDDMDSLNKNMTEMIPQSAIRKHNLDEIRETIEATKSLKKVRRTHSLGKNRMITLLDKQGKEIQEQDKIME